MLLRPPTPISPLHVTIKVQDDWILTRFAERHDGYIALVRSLGYVWEPSYWRRRIRPIHGAIEDRGAELCVRLLAAGFIVDAPDAWVERIRTGTFEPEHSRWILKLLAPPQYAGWFSIQWGRGEDYYHAARRIAGSRYLRPHVIAPPESYDEVQDFAERFDFRITPAAQEVMEQARKEAAGMLIVCVTAPPKAAPGKGHLEMPDLEATDGGIDDELADEPL